MGSDSDLPTMQGAADMLNQFGISYELTVVSAHRTPERMMDYAGKAKERGLKVHLETSGAYPYSGDFDWVCMSPKKMQAPLPAINPITSELKVIVNNKQDFIWAEDQREGLTDDCKLYLQAEWSKREKIIPMIIDFVKENKDWTISLQSHKYMNIP